MPTDPTFIWEVSNNTAINTEPRVLEAQFGDGVRQVATDGLNALPHAVSVEVGPVEPAEAQAVWDFLAGQAGMPFVWTPIKPLAQTPAWWTCKRFGFKPDGGLIRTVTAEFQLFPRP